MRIFMLTAWASLVSRHAGKLRVHHEKPTVHDAPITQHLLLTEQSRVTSIWIRGHLLHEFQEFEPVWTMLQSRRPRLVLIVYQSFRIPSMN